MNDSELDQQFQRYMKLSKEYEARFPNHDIPAPFGFDTDIDLAITLLTRAIQGNFPLKCYIIEDAFDWSIWIPYSDDLKDEVSITEEEYHKKFKRLSNKLCKPLT